MTLSRRPPQERLAAVQCQVALDAIRGKKTLAEQCKPHDVRANQLVDWKSPLIDLATSTVGAESASAPTVDLVGINRGSVYCAPLHGRQRGLACWFNFYNTARPRSSLDEKTPDEFYFATLPATKQAN